MKSLRTKLVLLYVGLVLLVLLVFSGVILYAKYAEARSDFDERLATESALFSNVVLNEINDVPDGVAGALEKEVEEIRQVTRLTSCTTLVQRKDGRALVQDDGLAELWRQAGLTFDELRLRPYKQTRGTIVGARFNVVKDKKGEEYLIGYGIRWDPYVKGVYTIGYILAALLVLSTAASFALAHVYLGRVLRPIQEMTRKAQEINANNLREPISVPSRSGEFTQLAQVLNGMLDRIDVSFGKLRSLLSDVSHEVKTPLGNVRLWLEAMLAEERSKEELQKFAARAIEEVQRTARLITDLLTLSQLEAGASGLRREKVDLTQVTRDVVETARLACEQKGIRLDLTDSSDCIVEGDPDALRRIFANVINNAIYHTPAQGRITVDLKRDNGRVLWGVRDTGAGIPPEVKARLFQRFNRGSEGTGLGLAICKSIVDAHSGQIQVDSHPGDGTQVQITLPTAKTT